MSTQTVLFWNIHQKPLYDSVVQLCHRRGVDFLLLAESKLDGVRLIEKLNRGKARYWVISTQKDDLAVFARHPLEMVRAIDIPKLNPTDQVKPLTSPALFFRVELGLDTFNLVVVHLRSQLRGKPEDWKEAARIVNERIRKFETEIARNERTIVVGDFNMNPFDEGLVAASCFHAMMTRDLVTTKGRSVQRLRHPFFYNPMWSRFGCESVTGRPPGTYYYDKPEQVRFYWNIFDQVLVRPGLLNSFRDEDLEVIQHDGQSPLRKNGKPDAESFSDHLPILFKLTF